jgi:hypothetical protein
MKPFSPYVFKARNPSRGYLMITDDGLPFYEMELNEDHIAFAAARAIMLIDANSMTIYDYLTGEWQPLMKLSEITR